MVAAALADGTLDAPERRMIEERLEESGLDAAAQQQIRDDFGAPLAAERLAALAPSAEGRETLYRLAALVVLADGDVGEQERAWLDRLAGAFDFTEARRSELEREVLP